MARKPAKKAEDKPLTPLNEQVGRCANCAGSRFKHAIEKRLLLRGCQDCGEVYDIDNERVVRQGDPAKKWEG